jgi:hypothetical protein
MPFATTALIAGGLAAAGGIGGAALSSHAAGEAAQTQSDAAVRASQIQADQANKALDFQKQEWNTEQSNIAPWLKAGKQGLTQLQALMNSGGLLKPFTPPTLAEAEKYPGYQFGLDQSEEAMQNSAAAKGNLLSGNTQEALSKFAQNYAQNDYTNVYNQAFNTFETNQTNTYNRLAALAGIGQQANSQLGTLGQSAAGNVANISLTSGAQQGQDIQNAAAATASGYVGGANAWAGALGGGTNNLSNLLLLNKLGGFGGGGVTGGIDLNSVPNSGFSNPAYYGIP